MKALRDLPVFVTHHAVGRYEQRAHEALPGDVRQAIRACVEAGISAGRVSEVKPRAFRLYKERVVNMPNEFFVWTSDGELLFTIRREPDRIVVITTLSSPTDARVKQRVPTPKGTR